jgi:general secretion pathway protein E
VWSGSGHPADLRISVMPTNHGERVVIRVANVGLTVPDLTRLGVPPALLDRLRALLARPQGIVFVTGPTGSGKTTTIYSALAHIKQARGETTQITTIEDPIEFDPAVSDPVAGPARCRHDLRRRAALDPAPGPERDHGR